jgi:hypothetical protein
MRGYSFTGSADGSTPTAGTNVADFYLTCNTTGDLVLKQSVSWTGVSPSNAQIAIWSAQAQAEINSYVGALVPG